MIKKYLIAFNIIKLSILILLISFSSISYSKEKGLSVKTITIDSAFIPNIGDGDYEPDDTQPNFINEISEFNPPVLVDYEGQKSLLIFVPSNKDDKINSGYIYNFNLANQKMNVVSPHLEGNILSVFAYNYKGKHPSVILVTETASGSDATLYRVWMYTVLKEDGGLYIQSFRDDRFGIEGLTSCIEKLDNVCKYKNAVSIKKFLDDINKKGD